MNSENLPTLITGLPRGGTTLMAAVLNQQPNCIALAEPMFISKMSQDPAAFSKETIAFADETRRLAINEGTVVSKTVAGQMAGNFFVNEADRKDGLRKTSAERTFLKIDKSLTPDFRLFMKHPAAFTSLIETLSKRFPLIACIRAPLAVLAAWQTVDMPINKGRSPMSERFSPQLKAVLDQTPNVLARQIYLMQWFLKKYTILNPEQIIRFEDLIRNPRAALTNICPENNGAKIELGELDLAKRYPSVDLDMLRHALKPIDDIVRLYYPEGSAKGH